MEDFTWFRAVGINVFYAQKTKQWIERAHNQYGMQFGDVGCDHEPTNEELVQRWGPSIQIIRGYAYNIPSFTQTLAHAASNFHPWKLNIED